jgi:hypothetical protein
MTHDEAIELLRLMRRQQQEEDSAAPLDPEMLARAYVRMFSGRRKICGEGESGETTGKGGERA